MYEKAMVFHVNFSLFDMQLDHVTRCESPSSRFPDEEGWYYNFGDAEGSDEAAFSVARVIGEAR